LYLDRITKPTEDRFYTMSYSENLHQRIVELGREIFELAEAARPRVWQAAWGAGWPTSFGGGERDDRK
jgi:hypothetical protein